MRDQAEKLRAMARSLKQQIASELGRGLEHTRVIAVTSGKGGVGKTNLALNLALALAQKGLKVTLLDADMGMANIDIIMGLVPEYNLYHVLRGEKSIRDIMLTGPFGLKFIPGGSGIQELANLSEDELARVVAELGRLDGESDVLLIDTGAGIANNVLAFVTAADDIIVVTSPEPTSLTDAYGIIKVAAARRARGTIYLVVNRVGIEAEGTLVAHKLTTVAQRFLGVEVAALGSVLEDEAVERAVRSQEPLLVAYPGSPAARGVRAIADRIIAASFEDKTAARPGGLRSFFRSLT
ncbi:MAG: MinD/ParA family protein, partial [Syntrophomonadaceae bacterium]|nr:MinD/ParA family protein [Syntrophomonadaceae bacterium]